MAALTRRQGGSASFGHCPHVLCFCLFQKRLTSECPAGVTTMRRLAGFSKTRTPRSRAWFLSSSKSTWDRNWLYRTPERNRMVRRERLAMGRANQMSSREENECVAELSREACLFSHPKPSSPLSYHEERQDVFCRQHRKWE